MTTHVSLVARAFGADRVVIPAQAGHVSETVDDVIDRFGGGSFAVTEVSDPLTWVKQREEPTAHLTMYGQPVQELIPEIRERTDTGPLTVIVGGGKVPGDLYDLATWNVAVTNQPHSEIAALAVFLDHYTEGAALETSFEDADFTVVPTEAGKRVIPTEEE